MISIGQVTNDFHRSFFIMPRGTHAPASAQESPPLLPQGQILRCPPCGVSPSPACYLLCGHTHNIHMYIYTHARTNTHAHIHTRLHTYIFLTLWIHKHNIYIYILYILDTHARTHAHTYTHRPACYLLCGHTHTQYTYVYIYTHTHAHAHTQTHTYIHTYIPVDMGINNDPSSWDAETNWENQICYFGPNPLKLEKKCERFGYFSFVCMCVRARECVYVHTHTHTHIHTNTNTHTQPASTRYSIFVLITSWQDINSYCNTVISILYFFLTIQSCKFLLQYNDNKKNLLLIINKRIS